MTERRFTEEEVAAIIERATEAQQSGRRQLHAGEGMTLGDLQEIGKEIGVTPELIAQAARSIEQAGQPTAREFLGLPIGVGRTIDLDRRLSEEEWERLVVDLRSTFDARGSLKSEGSFKQWTNGNLQVLLEPTESGHRVRMRTIKGDARALMQVGLAIVGTAVVTWTAGRLFPGLDPAVLWSAAATGAGLFTIGALRVPGWARVRRRQMEEIAARLTARIVSE